VGSAASATRFLRIRGLAPGTYFKEWMNEQLAASPLARELGKTELTFADMRRRDLPPRAEIPDITDAQYERATYRLHVIGSEVTTGRMLVLPDALSDYGTSRASRSTRTASGRRRGPHEHELPVPVQPGDLHKGGNPYYVVDGGLLSNFPIWLFDSPNPSARPGDSGSTPALPRPKGLPYRKIPRPLWAVPLLKRCSPRRPRPGTGST